MDSTNPPNGWPHHRIPKRSHDEMQRGHRESSDQASLRRPAPFHRRANSPPSASSTPPPHAPQHPQTSGLHLPPLRHRFAGDGFDFRRPAMSTPAASSHRPPADVIDLTSEDDLALADSSATPIAPPVQSARASRPPRFAREIIDLSDDTPAHPPPPPPAQNAAPSSPEVEFVSSRTIPGRRRAPATAVDLTDVEDDFEFEMFFADFGPRHGVNRAPPGDGGFRTRSRRNSPVHRRLMHILDGLLELNNAHTGFLGPGVMNYGAAAFDLGLEREATPTYEAPPKAPSGFTRSPEEGDALACPNCDAELCAGPDGDEKRQVWVIRACGHVYCGECARNRHASKRKGKEPAGSSSRLPNPFQKCVVKDCGKKCTARTAMVQLFL